jgi:peptide/nickel transport system substrate-binding protein
MTISRRALLQSAAATGTVLAMPAVASAASTVTFIPSSDLLGIDPIWTTAYVVRNHGYLVYDTLYSTDANYHIQPQMAEGHEISPDGLTVSIRLREGLRFHDGALVLARDCVQSIRRWAARDGLGQMLMGLTNELVAVDDRTLRFRLKSAFPLLVPALGKLSSPVPFMMPERVATTDPNTQIKDATGCGPFRFLADEWVQGSRAAYAKFTEYVPRPEPASGAGGGKHVNIDRLQWLTIPDFSTAVATLKTAAADWMEASPVDLVPTLSDNKDIVVRPYDELGYPFILRFNHLQAPFNDVKAREAVLAAVTQSVYLQAAVGNPQYERECRSFMPCGTPYSTGAGSDAMAGSLDAARKLLAASKYSGERVVILQPTDNQILNASCAVTYDLLTKMGMKAELAASDIASMMRRRASQEPVEKGGWSLFVTSAASVEYANPAAHLGLRSDGAVAWAGWPTDPRMEELRRAFIFAPDDTSRRKSAAEIEQEAFTAVPYVPLGQYIQPTAYRRSLTDLLLPSSAPFFWNLRKA